MKFCFITTFFGAHSFGGDAVAVERLAAALLRRGHEVHLIYPIDAFNLLNGYRVVRHYQPPPGLKIHALHSPHGALSQLMIHQSGSLSDLYAPVKAILDAEPFDVIHAHNISLIGGPGLLNLITTYPAVTLMTTHENWLLCPLTVLWRFNRVVCDHPTCVPCTIAAGRPPQWWRYSRRIPDATTGLDAMIAPSRYTLTMHESQGIRAKRMAHIPYFLPDDWGQHTQPTVPFVHKRPYFLAVGRLVKEKGFQTLIPGMANFPDVDLLIAGDGNYAPDLKRLAAALPNVHFMGYVQYDQLMQMYRQAVALLVPSLVLETFGNIVLESLALNTPVIARNRSALRELIAESVGGLCYDTDDELTAAMRQLLHEPGLRSELVIQGKQALRTTWSESTVVSQYLDLIEEIRVHKSS